jgi:hypothetical protein
VQEHLDRLGAACRGKLTIGSRTPAMADTNEAQPAVQLTTTGVATCPRLVVTPVTRPSVTSTPSTSVCWWIWTPAASAARA